MSANAPAWLTARPIAHRGLHAASKGVVENTLGAARAAIASDYAVECDIQLSGDGEAIVFHDDALERLTHGEGQVGANSVQTLQALKFRQSEEAMPTLGQILAAIDGRTPLICEIKSRFDGDLRLANRAAEIAAPYRGPLAFKSFDPAVIGHLRAEASPRPLGVVAQAKYDDDYWRQLSAAQKRDCANFLHIERTRPDFLSWSIDDLPHPTPFLLRQLAAMPVIVWTVRDAAQRATAAHWADQIIFEAHGAP